MRRFILFFILGYLCIFSLVLLLWSLRTSSVYINEERYNLLQRVIPSVENIAEFFNGSKDYVNLDGVVGIRIAAEQLLVYLNRIEENCDNKQLTRFQNIIIRLTQLQKNLEIIADDSVLFIQKNDPQYYKDAGFLVQKNLWTKLFPIRSIDLGLLSTVQIGSDKSAIPETAACLKEWQTNYCRPSNNCWKKMTNANYNGYFITHKLLYLLIGISMGCDKQAEKLSQKYFAQSLEKLLTVSCSKILKAANKEADDGFHLENQDIFMERVSFCGLIGFQDFFKLDWIRKIISWQQPSACYGDFSGSMEPTVNKRVKREELEMPGGCLSHKTTLGLLSLQQAIRFLLEPHFATACSNWI